MESLADYLRECEGAATPASTMGMGNPAAPGECGAVGSGDLLTAKAKKEKKKKKIEEGLLDADFGLDDSFDDNLLDSYIDTYVEWCKNTGKPSGSQYKQFYDNFMLAVESVSKRNAPASSMMKAFRSKEYTIVIFKNTTGLGHSGYRNWGSYEMGIEIRRFIKNPLPEAIEMAWDPAQQTVLRRYYKRVNHPDGLSIKSWKCFVLPGHIYDKVYSSL